MTGAAENTIAIFRIGAKLLARRSADNSVTIRLFGVAAVDAGTSFDAEEVDELAEWLARRVEEPS